MANPVFEVLTPVGRLVGGHPMDMRPQVDSRTNQPKMKPDGVTQITQCYIGVAIPKGTETHWSQTEWGQQIYQAGVQGWPNGEHGAPTFAWKITDGDSQIPNTKQIKPCDREGYPGHWVLNMSSNFAIKCYHKGKYDPAQQIQNQAEIKPGDYCRVSLNAVANNPAQSPGVYLNPMLFELYQPGVEIVLSGGPSASEAFGGSAGQLPPGAQVDTNVAPAPVAGMNQAVAAPAPVQPVAAPVPAPAPVANAVQPAADFVNPAVAPAPVPAPAAEPKYSYQGQVYTREQLLAAKWTEQQIAALPPA